MEHNKKVDYLIVGQGIAGTILTYQLIKRNKTVAIIDNKPSDSSSRVAAGLFNPITGRKFVKTWKADELFPCLHSFYREFETYLGAKFFRTCEIFRPFENLGEQNDWDGKTANDDYKDYIEVVRDSSLFPLVKNPHGGLLVKNGGFLDLNTMLDVARAKFSESVTVVEETFDPTALKVNDDGVEYGDIKANRLINCAGSNANMDPLFSWLPFRLVKGEVLHLQSDEKIEHIFNKGCFITPPLNGVCRAGSTYDWKDLTTKPTENGRNTIMEKLNALIKWQVEIKDHKAGIRPATLDRKPFIGVHPEFATIFVFNGLGTKGVSLAPYFSEQFVGYLEDGLKLDSEVDIKRYYSLYYNSYTS